MTKLFTLSGGHLFSIYDGCREEGIDIVDVRHEQTAAFAAEGWAKVTREPGVCALTAGPGRDQRHERDRLGACRTTRRCVVLGGRAPALRWGQGSLQEIDHVPFVRAADASSPRPRRRPPRSRRWSTDALDAALGAARRADLRRLPARRRLHGGARPTSRRRRARARAASRPPTATGSSARRRCCADAERPVIMAGTGLYWGHGEDALRELAEELGIPVFLNGLGRGCLPADHELFFSRARGAALKGADVALVIGVPIDFRLGFGGSFGEETEIDRARRRAEPSATHRAPDRRRAARRHRRDARGAARRRRRGAADARPAWVEQLRGVETEKRAGEQAELSDDRAPLHPVRVYARARRGARPRRDRRSATAATSSPTPAA